MDLRLLKSEGYHINDGIMYRRVSDETTMAYNPENGDMYELNDISREIITMLGQHMDGELILQTLTTDYDVDISTIIEDVSPLLDRFVDLKILILK